MRFPAPLNRRYTRFLIPLFGVLLSFAHSADPAPVTVPSIPVTITVDAAAPLGPVKPIWRFFGADEPNYATMKDGKKLLSELGALAPQQIYFRTHNLLCTGDGTPALKWGSTGIYTEDALGNPIYNWTIVDAIFDNYLARGVRPYAQLGFMPAALSTHPEPYQHEWRPGIPYQEIMTGWTYPPKDYNKWRELAFQWVKHCVERYGRAEVEQWYWEVWNEANGHYWKGTPEEFYKLHDYAIDGVRRALPTARVGGPHVAGSGGAFMDGFLKHISSGTNYATSQPGTPTDFLSFHAKGKPAFLDGHVRLGLYEQLKAIDNGFKKIAALPSLKHLPIILGESDPDGCAACTASVYPQNNYRNSSLYASYTAASFARKTLLAERHGVNLEGAVTWAFEFEDQPYFAGFRVLATNGIDLPVLNTFRMFAHLSGQRLKTHSTSELDVDEIIRNSVRSAPDIAAVASLDGHKLCILAWHYHDDDLPGAPAAISLAVSGLPPSLTSAKFTHYRIDENHSNAFTAWQKMGSPAGPDLAQYKRLLAAGQLAQLTDSPTSVPLDHGTASFTFPLPRQAVSLLIIELP